MKNRITSKKRIIKNALKSLLTIVLIGGGMALAQSPQIIWQNSLGGTDKDFSFSICPSTSGSLAVGYTKSNDSDVTGNHGSYDAWIVLLDHNGEIIWENALGGSAYDQMRAAQQTTDGGYILAGSANSNDGDVSGHHGSSSYADYWVVKLDASGNIDWQKSLGGTSPDVANSIQQTTDGGYIVGGYSQSNDGDISGNHGANDYWIVKLDSTGNIDWQKSLGGSDWDYHESVTQTTDGGYIVAGYAKSNDGDVSSNHGQYDYWIVKLDASGNIDWEKSLGGSDDDYSRSIIQTSDNGYVIAGGTKSNDGDVSSNNGMRDSWIVKLDAFGNIDWEKSFGGSSNDHASSIQQTLNGGFIVINYAYSNDGDVNNNQGGADYWVIQLDSIGNIQWKKTIGGSNSENPFEIFQASDRNFIMSGYSYSNDGDLNDNYGLGDYWVVKLSNPAPFAGDVTGDDMICIDDVTTLVASGDVGGDWNSDNTAVATVDNSGKVTGVSEGTATISYEASNSYGTDEATFDITVEDCSSGIENISKKNHVQSYYNPEFHTLQLNLAVPNGHYELAVLNSIGQLIFKDKLSVNQNKQTATYDMQRFSSGIYYIKLVGNGTSYNDKFVKR